MKITPRHRLDGTTYYTTDYPPLEASTVPALLAAAKSALAHEGVTGHATFRNPKAKPQPKTVH